MKSVTFKSLQRTTDGLFEPTDESQDLTLGEFQFQKDPEIYLRLVEAMTGAQRMSEMRIVRGVIIFGDASLDPKTEPWHQVIETYVLRDCIEDLERREPQHPLVAVFKPLLARDVDVLERHAVEYYRTIKHSSLKQTHINVLTEVFVDWLRQRTPKKSLKEIEMLLFGELTPLEETQSGKDLIEIGEKRGEQHGIATTAIAQLECKFARVPQTLQKRINKLDVKTLQALTVKLLSFERIQDVKQWLDSNSQ